MINSNRLGELSITEIMQRAYQKHIIIPAFNTPYPPMVKAIAEMVKTMGSFALVEVAKPDIDLFGAESYEVIAREFNCYADRNYLRLHQDHVPVIDERWRQVDWKPLIQEALQLNYDSVMLDGSRLPLDGNIEATRTMVAMAHTKAAAEGELGAVLGHEEGPLPPYEELFKTGRGFTDPDEAERFVRETGVDWLSVAIGNIHGAISGAARADKKVEARLSIEHLRKISDRVGIPLVLHGGTGIKLPYLLEAIKNGITKINIGMAIRHEYEAAVRDGKPVEKAQEGVAREVARHLQDFQVEGSAAKLAA